MTIKELKELLASASDNDRLELVNGEITLVKDTPQPITERIKTFEDAYQWCVENGEANLVNHHDDWEIYNDTSKDIIAYLKLRIITAALNEGWEPNGSDGGYIPRITEVDNLIPITYMPNIAANIEACAAHKLWLKSEELASYAGVQFSDIYADFCGCKKGGEK